MNIVKELRERAGMQQKELAILVGVSRPTVSEWEHGKKDPSKDRLKKLAQIFGCDIGTILGYQTMIPIRQNAVPILGDIACGDRRPADQTPDGFAPLPEGIHADFALRCHGDSMSPTLLDGDLVLIRQQPEVENGQIAAISIDGETTLKHVYRRDDGILLVADNPAYSPVYVPYKTGDEFIIHGLAIGYTRIFA